MAQQIFVKLQEDKNEAKNYGVMEKQNPRLKIETLLKKYPHCMIQFPPASSFIAFFHSFLKEYLIVEVLIDSEIENIVSTKSIYEMLKEFHNSRYKTDYSTWNEAKSFIKVEEEKNGVLKEVAKVNWNDPLLNFQKLHVTFTKKRHWMLVDAISRLFSRNFIF